jgi:formylglycine-generating enzyme required for sulfatase activity
MKHRVPLLAGMVLLFSSPLSANNLEVSNISIVGTTAVQFDVSWDNSWFVPGSNWDAVWVFVKAQDCNGSRNWDHVDLSNVAASHSVSGGTGLTVEASSDGKGVFIRRNSLGGGTQSGTVTVQFATEIEDAAATNFRVFGVEMVWVPQGDFRVGDGSTNNTSHSTASLGSSGSTPRAVTSENAVGMDFFRNDKGGDNFISAHNALPAAFPKGWAGFYCMKYEISQQQYVAFLNSLSLAHQFTRTTNNPTAAAGTLAMTNTANQNRNAIVVSTPAANGAPAVYATDLNGDGTYGDGDEIACNYLSWADLLAYLDWSGLRPMTELEYEKAARGTVFPVLNEYSWGSNAILQATSDAVNGAGTAAESSTAMGDGLCAHNGGASTSLGPLRVGFAATAVPSRAFSGASQWGIMELSGNVWEQTISIGYWNGSTRLPATFIFTGANGDGQLSLLTGDADVATWPLAVTPGTLVVRGGNWESDAQRAQTSDRRFVNSVAENSNRLRRTGGRGVRRP